MRVPLIATLNANTPGNTLFPEINQDARIEFSAVDGDVSEYNVEKIDCRDFLQNGKVEINFWLNGTRHNSWKIYISDRRIVVWNPFTSGLIGKAKEKADKVSAGHLLFESISNLSAFYDQSGVPVFIVCCYRQDGTRTVFSIQSQDIATMKSCATELHQRIDEWLIKNGCKLEQTEEAPKEHLEALERWGSFTSKLWEKSDCESNVFIPNKEWSKVPNSRLSS